MKERPILMSTPMVQAILAGRKTQTRRVLQPRHIRGRKKPVASDLIDVGSIRIGRDGALHAFLRDYPGVSIGSPACPYGVPGDRLWCRETWRGHDVDGSTFRVEYKADDAHALIDLDAHDGADTPLRDLPIIHRAARDYPKWMPSIFLPRPLSRIRLSNESVRVQRLQEISEEDARAEGMLAQAGDGTGLGPGWKWSGIGYHGAGFNERGEPTFHIPARDGRCACNVGDRSPAVCAYRELWDSINGERAPWSSNPWVWCVSFRRCAAAQGGEGA